MNSTFSYKSTGAKQLERQEIKEILPPKQTRVQMMDCIVAAMARVEGQTSHLFR